MPDRVIRDELLDSDRWLNLGHDTERLAFVALLLRCDDFGNLEAGAVRLFRFLSHCTQIKTPENVATVLMHLADSDLIRSYSFEGRELIHIPRLRPHRQYLVRRCPPSPWCDISVPLGKSKRVVNKGIAKNVVTTSQQRSNDVAQGVGVGVGVGVGEVPKTRARKAEPVDNSNTGTATPAGNKLPKGENPNPASPAAWWKTSVGIAAKGIEYGMPAHRGELEAEYKDRLFREQEKRKRVSA